MFNKKKDNIEEKQINKDAPDGTIEAPPLKPFSGKAKHSPSKPPVSTAFQPDITRRQSDFPSAARLRTERSLGSSYDSRRLVVGRDIRLKGEITACDKLLVEGHVEIVLPEAGSIEIASSGFFKGKADWRAIKKIKDCVSIPVVVNGDIIDLDSALTAISESKADGVMIGRAAIGRPWFLKEISNSLFSKDKQKIGEIDLDILIAEHLQSIIEFYNERIGLLIFRKHLAAYLKNLKIDKELGKEALKENSLSVLFKKINFIFKNQKLRIV